jgi:hypothetical protein
MFAILINALRGGVFSFLNGAQIGTRPMHGALLEK